MHGIVPTAQLKPSSKGWWILLIMPLFLLAVVVFSVISLNSQPARLEKAYEKDPSLRPAPVVNTPSTGNIAHDRLMGLSAAGQALILGRAVAEGCVGDRAFYMGMYKKEALWSVGCTNGKSYEVKLAADAMGSAEALDCSVFKAITHLNCFVKLGDQ